MSGLDGLGWPNPEDEPRRDTRRVKDYFKEDGEPIRCPHCECTDIKENVLAVVDVFQGHGPTCEAEYQCRKCHKLVGYWAYGSWHPDDRQAFIDSLQCDCRFIRTPTVGVDEFRGAGPNSQGEYHCLACGARMGQLIEGAWHPDSRRTFDDSSP